MVVDFSLLRVLAFSKLCDIFQQFKCSVCLLFLLPKLALLLVVCLGSKHLVYRIFIRKYIALQNLTSLN